MKHTTKDRILLSVANVAQLRTTSLDAVGQKPFSSMVSLVCVMMVLKMLHVTDTARIVAASQVFFSPKMASSPPVVGVFVLLRRRSRIETVT